MALFIQCKLINMLVSIIQLTIVQVLTLFLICSVIEKLIQVQGCLKASPYSNCTNVMVNKKLTPKINGTNSSYMCISLYESTKLYNQVTCRTHNWLQLELKIKFKFFYQICWVVQNRFIVLTVSHFLVSFEPLLSN